MAQVTPSTAQPQPTPQGTDAILNATAKGVVITAVFGLTWGLWALARTLWRRSRTVVARAAAMAGNTSAKDVARAAGSASVKVQRKTAGVLNAFQQGRRDAEKRDDES